MKLGTVSLITLTLLLGGCTEGTFVFGGNQTVPAKGIALSKVSMFQGVEVPLMRDGEPASGLAGVVAGRDGMLRVYVETRDVWVEREVRAVLTIKNGDEVEELYRRMVVSESSSDMHLDSTFNFDLTGAQITPETRFAVDLMEVDTKTKWEGSDGNSYYPAENTSPMNAETSDHLEVVIIPVRYNADGSGRLPDTSAEQIQAFRDIMYGMYPATDVTVRVDDPIDWYQDISPMGQGWDSILYEIMWMRGNATHERPNTYYYGLFNPSNSIYSFCGQGCVLGMSTVGSPSDVWSRASVGVGFSDETSVTTLPHEVGHAHGREHSPCGLYGQPADPAYPHDDAELGVWGWDMVNGLLVRPDTNFDVLSYCDPMWVSDWTYDALHVRLQELASGDYARSAYGFERTKWRAITVHADGSARLDRTLELDRPPTGEDRTVVLLDADGNTLGTTTGHYHALTALDAGMVLIEDPGIAVKDVIVY